MKFKFYNFILFCFSIGFLSVACRESPAIENLVLLGKWNIEKAERDGKTTKSLQKGYFEFFESQKLFSNILDTSDTLTYRIEGRKILIEDLNYKFQVLHHSSDSLTLRTRINKSNYKMILLRS